MEMVSFSDLEFGMCSGGIKGASWIPGNGMIMMVLADPECGYWVSVSFDAAIDPTFYRCTCIHGVDKREIQCKTSQDVTKLMQRVAAMPRNHNCSQ